jgi:hypothetical protein
MEVLTKEECKKILSKVGFKLGVSPSLITTRLLSDEDKLSMLDGHLTISSLEAAVEVWKDNGMPDYAHGNTERYETEKKRLRYEKSLSVPQEEKGISYRKPFVDYRVVD